jgi:hypothetical protein
MVCDLTEEQIKICKFLPVKYKQMLLELATISELVNAGYTRPGAYKAKEKGVISDRMCECLLQVLGDKARPILLQALMEFASQLNCHVNCEEPEEPEEREEEEEPEEAEEPEEPEEPEEED